MKKLIAVAVTISTFGFISAASAADLPTKGPVYTTSPYNWTGLYLGVNGGYGWGDTSGGFWSTEFVGDNYGISGGLFGGQVGYNYQSAGTPLVLGIEADWDWADVDGSRTFIGQGPINTSAKLENLGTVRGRIGYAWDRALFYGTAGWAWSRLKADCGNFCSSPIQSHTVDGYTLGAGLEYGITPNLSLKAEYLYVHLTPTDFFTNLSPNPCTGSCGIGANVNIVRLGLNWRFSSTP